MTDLFHVLQFAISLALSWAIASMQSLLSAMPVLMAFMSSAGSQAVDLPLLTSAPDPALAIVLDHEL